MVTHFPLKRDQTKRKRAEFEVAYGRGHTCNRARRGRYAGKCKERQMEGKVLLSCSSVTSKCKTQRLSIYKGGSQAQSVGSFQDGYVTTRPTGWEIFRHA